MSSVSRFLYVIKFPMNLKYRSSHRWCSLNEIFLKLRNIHRKTYVLQYLLNKVTGLQVCNFTKKNSNTCVFLRILQTLRKPISKNIWERLLLMVVLYCIENWIKLFRNQIVILFLLKHKITLFSLLSFVFIRFITRCHSLPLIVIFCHSLSLAIRCHLLYHSFQSLSFVLPLVVIGCHSLSFVLPLVASLCHSLSFVITRCTTRLSFYRRSHNRTNKTRAFLRKKIYDGKKSYPTKYYCMRRKVFISFFFSFSFPM